jgi:excisionase family DNA binding protein
MRLKEVVMTLPIQPHIPNQPDINEAKNILQALRPDLGTVKIQLENQEFVLPSGIRAMFREILINVANGQSTTIIPHHAELTSQQAAEFLRVSRQFLVQEADAGRIQCHKVGTHRRFAFTEVLKYQQQMHQRSLEARQALADQAQELGLED